MKFFKPQRLFILFSLCTFLTAFAISATSYAGLGGGSDGGYDPRYDAQNLTDERLQELMEDNGYLFKEAYLIPLLELALLSPTILKEEKAIELFNEIKSQTKNLIEEVRKTPYVLGQIEQEGWLAKTKNKEVSAAVIFDFERMKNKVTLNQLIGIAVHEHSRHYIGNKDEDNKQILRVAFSALANVYAYHYTDFEKASTTADGKTVFVNPRILFTGKYFSIPVGHANKFCLALGYTREVGSVEAFDDTAEQIEMNATSSQVIISGGHMKKAGRFLREIHCTSDVVSTSN